MKKQMTILAAAAILGTFAVGAIAAVPTVTLTGGFAYAVEYSLLDRTWTNGADNVLNNAAGALSFSVATAGNPNLGTLTFTNAFPGAASATLSGTVKGYDVSLGAVSADWDAMSAGTAGAGATVGKAFGALTTKVATTNATGIVNAFRVGATLGTASVYGGLVLNPEWEGLAYAGATSKIGPAAVTAKAGMILNGPSAFSASADMAAGPNLKLLAVAAVAPSTYTGSHINAAASGTAVVATDLMIPGWVAATRPGTNVYLQANLTVNPNVAPYASFDYRAGTGDYIAKVGTSFKTLYVNDASVVFTGGTATTTEFLAALGKGIVSASVGYKIPAAGPAESKAEVRVTQPIDWLTTYAAVGKAYAATTPYIIAGASAGITF